ncbi:class I SAM-dependent methyltransferase [Paenibacillus larvae]|uniref:class I SAM-dependent methyltransferase n=1 Tax=Paenibacillus larvae TaxID=1464 RepID=UPI002854088D|nr:class I SAM-dependent methyltransferase [Paenibacillus larvae]MDR5584409.1 class I SAM-dependent methyltransferase [Paenibacillus larvae]
MGFVSVLSYAHQLIRQKVQPGESVIDATAGNGVDTLFLASLVGPSGKVYGFDIQKEAIRHTRDRLAQELPSSALYVTLIQDSHHRLTDYLPEQEQGKIAAAKFNLGYLPGAETRTITRPDTTLPALEAALASLRRGGILTVVLYPGHEGGREEADKVTRWAAELPQNLCQVLEYRFLNRRSGSPYLLALEKTAKMI